MRLFRQLIAVLLCSVLFAEAYVVIACASEPTSASLLGFPETLCQETPSLPVTIGDTTTNSNGLCIDLRMLEKDAIADIMASLADLPNLSRIRLSPGSVTLEELGQLQSLPSRPVVEFPLKLYGKEISTSDEVLDLNKVRIDDGGAALRELLPYMSACSRLELVDCGLGNNTLADLQRDFPAIQVVWRIKFGCYSVLTDETRILASIKGKELTGEMCRALKYCTKVRYLDLGHNIIDDISFVQSMPDLEVAVLAINYWSDASPLASCKKLEYLEIFNTRCTDLSPLAGLTNLKHLNICWIKQLEDISPLYSLTGLERLWIGCVNKVPDAQLAEICDRLPDTSINITTDNPTSEGWRKHPRYELLCEQMGYNWKQPYSLPSGAFK